MKWECSKGNKWTTMIANVIMIGCSLAVIKYSDTIGLNTREKMTKLDSEN